MVSHGGTAGTSTADDRMVVMDWRPGTGTFVYSVDLGRGRRLVEETCLAGAPAVDIGELARRLADGYWGGRPGSRRQKGGRSRVSAGPRSCGSRSMGLTPTPWRTSGASRFGAAEA